MSGRGEDLMAAIREGVFGEVSENTDVDRLFTRPKFRRLDVLEMVNTLPPEVPWIAEPALVRGMLTLLYGREGEGKSFIALSLSIAVAAGEPVAGFEPVAGKVLYVDAENAAGEIHRRVRGLGLPPGAASRLVVYEAEGVDLRHDLEELEALVAEERPALLVLDSFRSLWGGKENDSDETGPVLDRVRNLGRRLDAATLLLHHSGKSGVEYRGSTAIGAACELVFQLAREPDDEDPERCYLACRKSRPAPRSPRRWLRLSTDVGLTLLDEVEAPEQEPRPVGRPSTAMHALSPDMEEALRLTTVPLTLTHIARACGRAPTDGSVRRVLAELVRQGRAERLDDGRYWHCQNAGTLKGATLLAPVPDWRAEMAPEEAS